MLKGIFRSESDSSDEWSGEECECASKAEGNSGSSGGACYMELRCVIHPRHISRRRSSARKMSYSMSVNGKGGRKSLPLGNQKAASPDNISCNAPNDLNNTAIHQWTKLLDCTEFVGANRSKHTVVAYEDAMFVFGGDNGKNMLNDLLRFGVQDKSWGRACATGDPPAPRYHHSAVVYGTSMFIFGGYTGDIHFNSNLTNRNDLFEYKFQTAQWVQWKFSGKPKPAARSAHGAAVYDHKLWIYAGYDGHTRLNDMWTLNLNGEIHQWEQVDQYGERPPTCCNFPVAVARDCMYVFSGQSGLQITNSLFEFDFKSKIWRRISNDYILRGTAAPPSRRFGHTMVHHDRFLYVFGGSADSILPNDLHCFDLDSKGWSVITPEKNSEIPRGRVFHASAVIGDAMYIFGGTVDRVRRGDTYRFQFSSYPKCTLSDDFGRFFNEKKFCDIQFIVGPEAVKIQAHIAFVAARSKFLRTKILAALSNNTKTQKSSSERPILEVELPKALPEAFEIVLNYMYTDRIDLKEPYSKNIVILITDIYQLAEQFVMPRLEQACIRYLNYKLTKQNALEALNNAEMSRTQLIKDHCLHFIIKEENFRNIVMSAEFADLDKFLVLEIIRKRLDPGIIPTDETYNKLISTTLEQDMAVFLRSSGKDFCDIDLVLESHIIPAHKSILSARCSYFQGMFRSFMPPDNTVKIQIGEILPSLGSFHALLRYIYYGETHLAPEDALYLFQAPCFYGFSNHRLLAFCKYSVQHKITNENILQTLEAADFTKIVNIKEYALKLIVNDFSKIAHLPKMAELSRDLLLEIIRSVADAQTECHSKVSVNTNINSMDYDL